MTRRLVVTYFTITAFALASLAVPLGITFAHRERDRLLFAIERDADSMSSAAQAAVTRGHAPPDAAIRLYASRTGGRVVIVDRRGLALVDTDNPSGPARNYSNRPEIIRALAGERTDGTRHSDTLGADLIYSAVPISGGDAGVSGAVRITYPSTALDARVRHTWSRIALLCLLVLCVVLSVGWLIARGVTRPLRRLEEAANRLARGDLDARVAEQEGPPEVRHLALAFNRMAAEIARLLEAQEQFVADASHQLRTPLTALRLRLENLGAGAPVNRAEAVDAIVADVVRMSRIVDGLLLLARDDTNPLATEAIDVAAVARSRGDAWLDVATEQAVELVTDAAVEAHAVVAPGVLEQVLDNLIDNALTASGPGGNVTIRVVPETGRVDLHVLDRGRGMTPEERRRAFDRFWRAPDATTGGSGLGLAIVRRLAEASGGTARLDERDGGGTDAVVSLPAGRAAPPAAKRAQDADATRPALTRS